MIVAIIDSGCFDHIDLKSSLIYGKNFTSEGTSQNVTDNNGHGTHIAGIIHRIVPEAQLLIIKALDRYGYGSVDDLTDAIYYALDKGADIINIAMGYEDPDDNLEAACEAARGKNIPIICAAGNNDRLDYPAKYCYSVGSINNEGNISSFSTHEAALYAKGEEIFSTYVNDSYETLSGTSMATAKVTGYIAKEISDNGSIDMNEFIKRNKIIYK